MRCCACRLGRDGVPRATGSVGTAGFPAPPRASPSTRLPRQRGGITDSADMPRLSPYDNLARLVVDTFQVAGRTRPLAHPLPRGPPLVRICFGLGVPLWPILPRIPACFLTAVPLSSVYQEYRVYWALA